MRRLRAKRYLAYDPTAAERRFGWRRNAYADASRQSARTETEATVNDRTSSVPQGKRT